MRWWSSSAIGWLWLATIAATACSNPTPGPCECVGDVPGGELDAACGETQCVAGTLYECTGRNTAAARGPCGPEANLRPAEAPDVVLLMVSGHCFTGPCGGGNPEYLVSERGTHQPIQDLFAAQGISTAVGGYSDSFYDVVDSRGEVAEYGFLSLIADLEGINAQWISDFDNPTHVIVVGHSHGTVWAHLALLVLEWWGRPVPVDFLVDLDGLSLGWESDTFTGFIGDSWKSVIRAYNREVGMTWPFDIADAADHWNVEGVADAQDTEDLVPDSVIANLEVFSDSTLLTDPDENHRRDGSRRNIVSFGPTGDHNSVTRPGSNAMIWVVDVMREAYGF